MENGAKNAKGALAKNVTEESQKMAGKGLTNLEKLKQKFDKIRQEFTQYLAKISGVVDGLGQTLADYFITRVYPMIPSYLVCGDEKFRIFYCDLETGKLKARLVEKVDILQQEYELSSAVEFKNRKEFLIFLNGTCKLHNFAGEYPKNLIGDEVPAKMRPKPGTNWLVESLSYPVGAFEICRPSDKRIIWIDDHRNIFVNTFTMPKRIKEYRRYRLVEGAQKGVKKRLGWGAKFPFIARVIDNVLGAKNDTKARDKFVHDLAYHLETFTPCFNLWLLLDKQGTGKGVLTSQILMRLYSDEDNFSNVARLSGAEFTSKWGDAFVNRLYLDIDEVEESSDKNGTTINQRVKVIVANTRYAVQLKFRDTQQVENHAFIVMSSNEKMPFKIDAGLNRRYNIVRGGGESLVEMFPQISANHDDWLNKTIDKEMPYFLQFLAQIPLDFKIYSTCLETDYKAFIVDSSTGDAQKIAELFMGQRTLQETQEYMSEMACEYVQHLLAKNIRGVAVSDLRKLFPQDFKEIMGVLKFNGVSSKVLRVSWLLDEYNSLIKIQPSKTLNGYTITLKGAP
ncbi:primase-helicase family protein [Helicobacter felis]|uniref:primase-helicase family protein n=1 Tax=Helicobacter felis TaxID=214 RepID=UPI000CEE47D5|nr:primase-helicase family protein [Helicobacter felis]